MKRLLRSLRYRLTQRPDKRTLRRHLPKDAVIVEAGAHDGRDTVAFAELLPSGHVHAFEPIPALYERLRTAVAHLPNVTTWPLAIGEEERIQPMFVGGGEEDASSSLLPPKEHLRAFPQVTFEQKAEVQVTTLTAWAEREGIERIDGLWLDMQGYELAALRAAGPALRTVRAMVLEVSSVELYRGAPLWPEVRAWLAGQGFVVEAEDWAHETFGNVLVRRDVRSVTG